MGANAASTSSKLNPRLSTPTGLDVAAAAAVVEVAAAPDSKLLPPLLLLEEEEEEAEASEATAAKVDVRWGRAVEGSLGWHSCASYKVWYPSASVGAVQ
jgi:hypothetical protein